MLYVAVAALIAVRAADAQHPAPDAPVPARAYSTEPVQGVEVAAWRADLTALVAGLERVHPDPYGRAPEARFDSAVAALHDSIPRLPAHRIVVAFARLLALVGDGHTSLPCTSRRA